MTHKLLLADDSITIQRVVELTFADQGVEVLAVGDGEAAIARIPVDQPDIVLADIGMPKRSGYDVAAFVKGHPDFRHIPVLLLAGAFEPVDEKRAEQVGCNGVLVKPFEPQHVISRVRELLGGAVGAPVQATPDVGRPVDRLASPRTLEFPKRDEPAPVEDAMPDPPSPIDDVLGDLPVTPDFPPAPEFATEAELAAPVPDLEPASEMPAFGESESLDDYFARLGAALEAPPAVVEPPAEPAAEEPVPVDEAPIPTLDTILAEPATDLVEPPPLEPPDTSPTIAPQPAAVPEVQYDASRNVVADAFSALLAVEAGEPDAAPVLLPSGFKGPVVTPALVDQIAQRVVERLAPDAARDLVREVVADVAERLVREEIERLRSKH
jgi:CheY-like chemotaxis protein